MTTRTNIVDTIQLILNYYKRTRGIGHTHIAIQALKAKPESLMVANQVVAKNLKDVYKELEADRFVSIETLASPIRVIYK